MNAAEVALMLQDDPETLMRKVSLKIFGGGTTHSGRHHFIIFDSQNTMPGFTSGLSGLVRLRKQRQVFHIKLRRTAAPNEVAAATAATTVFAQYISMRQTNEGVGITHRILPAAGGPDLMLTSQLTGCMFGIGSNAAGNRLVSHIQPDGTNANLANRRTDLTNATNLGYTNVDRTFVKGNDYQEQAMIVGIRRNGQWQIYAQHRDAVPIGGQNVELQVAGVSRLL